MINVKLNINSSIKEALNIIDKGAIRVAIVVDVQDKFLGLIADGDIRRALLKGYTLENSIENIYCSTPVTAKSSDSKDKIIQKAIKNQVYQIPILDEENYLVDIVNLSSLLSISTKRNRVILMAGGLGTRLRPLTEDTPKPMLKVGNKPILETIIRNFANHGFVNITISLNYKGEMIKDYFKDGSELGVNIDYIEENTRLGTAGALSLLENTPNEPFFVMNADLLTDVNFSHLLDFHSYSNANATMCVREYDYQIPYGVVETNEDNITSIVEKPIKKFFVNAGIYILSPNIFEFIPKDEFFDMPTLFNILIEKQKKVLSFPIHEYWLDIGRMSDFEQAQSEYFRIFDEK
ncbi:nucleotidyltransferase family protein [Aliarcobacter butzleri]|uniref:nucleotidyltransferase family protein n=1 Tax=Aliarcobacter butzleri TaxID=28197 RepID=UPI0021B3316A|nr:nucleotidyltransferase family protein [Aliarcobacter butzleri]MCT7562679.1 nucleotidyltransferase family protein [Aliarcobacter butzleri]MCT7637567.1 nucleotidyltransferase family protein [Aliarcobacter butzleri]